ncbi:MAG: 16S rRNA (cytidine(1402)-2'-O)-methyltransferase [Betaproteobacteria bacterium]
MEERGSEGGEAPASTASAALAVTAATLYVVATPLGHLRDITLRAIDVLSAVDLIYAEDTRVSVVLLARHGVTTRPQALHAHNEARRASDVIAALAAGRSVAMITDAGTPAISDPGARVVRAVRDAGFRVVPVPGPSAVAAALSAAGIGSHHFLFAGFLPTKAGERAALLRSLSTLDAALVFYEAPHRVVKAVDALLEALGGQRMLVVARELTKTFETIAAMPLADAPAWLAVDANRQRGEFVLIVDAPAAATAEDSLTTDARRWIDALVGEMPPSRAAHVVAAMTGAPRDALYQYAMARKSAR